MKYAIVVIGGAADLPVEELGDQTPLEAAATPHLDRLAQRGRVGLVATTPEALSPGTEVGLFSLLGGPVRGPVATGPGAAGGVFEARFGVRGVLVTDSEPAARVATLVGLAHLDGSGGLSMMSRAACEALGSLDLVCCHTAAADAAGRDGNVEEKVAAIEAIDAQVIGPLAERLAAFGDPADDPAAAGWRLLVAPDHATPVSTREPDGAPVPFVMAGAWIRSAVQREFSERGAADSDLRVEPGSDLLEYFLRGGLARVPSRVQRGP